jgi:hypothetical protein
MGLFFICLLIILINIPFGYWRTNVKKFSFQWIMAIHIPVPFIIVLRIYSDLGFAWYTYVFTIASFFLGQRIGAVLYNRNNKKLIKVSSCLVMDWYRNL